MISASQLLETRRSRFSRWAGAAVVVCAVHVGGAALALMHWQEEEAEDAAGAMTVELAPQIAAAPVDSPDVAHGPLQNQSTYTPEASKQVIEEILKDLPQVEPSPAPEPEVALPTPRPEAKEEPKEEEAKEPVPEKQNPDRATTLTLEMAPPRVEATPAPSSASSPGRSASAARAQASWQKLLVDHLNRYKQYPNTARNRHEQGTVVVAFRLDPSGQLISSHVTKSSGSSALDDEALAVLKRASPLPAPPDSASSGAVEWNLPIQFRMK